MGVVALTSFKFFCFKMAKRNLVIWLSVLEDMLEEVLVACRPYLIMPQKGEVEFGCSELEEEGQFEVHSNDCRGFRETQSTSTQQASVELG